MATIVDGTGICNAGYDSVGGNCLVENSKRFIPGMERSIECKARPNVLHIQEAVRRTSYSSCEMREGTFLGPRV